MKTYLFSLIACLTLLLGACETNGPLPKWDAHGDGPREASSGDKAVADTGGGGGDKGKAGDLFGRDTSGADTLSAWDTGGGKKDTGGGVKDTGGGAVDKGSSTLEGGTGLVDSGSGTKDSGGGVKDSGGGVKDSGGGVKDTSGVTPDAGVKPDVPQIPVDSGLTAPDRGALPDSYTPWFPDMYIADAFIWKHDFLPPLDSVVGTTDGGKPICRDISGNLAICACADGIDNDGDGDTDYPADMGCINTWDNDEGQGTTECTDGIDNDGDSLVDAEDEECTSPLDDDEGSYGTNIPGDNVPCSQDCFFDGNSGGGNDKCQWFYQCDPKNSGYYIYYPQDKCTYDATFSKCPAKQTDTCLKVCLPITPNGCDCFGCCQLSYNGVKKTVLLRASCEPQYLNDPFKCIECTQVPECLNTCGPCEVCIGKPKPEPWCFPKKDAGVPPTPDQGLPPVDRGPLPDGYKPPDVGPLPDGYRPPDLPPKPDVGPLPDGYRPPDLMPPDTYNPIPDSGIPPLCPNNWIYCGPGGIPPNSCPVGTYCITGCCVPRDYI